MNPKTELKINHMKRGSVFVCDNDDVAILVDFAKSVGRADVFILPRSVLSFAEVHCTGKTYSEFDYDDSMFDLDPVTSKELCGMLTFRGCVRV